MREIWSDKSLKHRKPSEKKKTSNLPQTFEEKKNTIRTLRSAHLMGMLIHHGPEMRKRNRNEGWDLVFQKAKKNKVILQEMSDGWISYCLAILWSWPLLDGENVTLQKAVGDLQLGDQKVTLNQLVYITFQDAYYLHSMNSFWDGTWTLEHLEHVRYPQQLESLATGCG